MVQRHPMCDPGAGRGRVEPEREARYEGIGQQGEKGAEVRAVANLDEMPASVGAIFPAHDPRPEIQQFGVAFAKQDLEIHGRDISLDERIEEQIERHVGDAIMLR